MVTECGSWWTAQLPHSVTMSTQRMRTKPCWSSAHASYRPSNPNTTVDCPTTLIPHQLHSLTRLQYPVFSQTVGTDKSTHSLRVTPLDACACAVSTLVDGSAATLGDHEYSTDANEAMLELSACVIQALEPKHHG